MEILLKLFCVLGAVCGSFLMVYCTTHLKKQVLVQRLGFALGTFLDTAAVFTFLFFNKGTIFYFNPRPSCEGRRKLAQMAHHYQEKNKEGGLFAAFKPSSILDFFFGNH